MITIEAAAFFAWLANRGYVADYLEPIKHADKFSIGTVWIDENERLTWSEWWEDSRVVSPAEQAPPWGRDLKDYLLCEYLNDPQNVRFTDCRTVDQLPTEFLTAAEKAAKQ